MNEKLYLIPFCTFQVTRGRRKKDLCYNIQIFDLYNGIFKKKNFPTNFRGNVLNNFPNFYSERMNGVGKGMHIGQTDIHSLLYIYIKFLYFNIYNLYYIYRKKIILTHCCRRRCCSRTTIMKTSSNNFLHHRRRCTR